MDQEPGARHPGRHPGNLRETGTDGCFQVLTVNPGFKHPIINILGIQITYEGVIGIPVIAVKLDIPYEQGHHIQHQEKCRQARPEIPALPVPVNKKGNTETPDDMQPYLGFAYQGLYTAVPFYCHIKFIVPVPVAHKPPDFQPPGIAQVEETFRRIAVKTESYISFPVM